jgi:energy-dependent translational throttle protein EttA
MLAKYISFIRLIIQVFILQNVKIWYNVSVRMIRNSSLIFSFTAFPVPLKYIIFNKQMSQETIIFSMERVSKTVPPQKQILKNIYLSFFYGAKIGVLGLNGSGKSSLLRIIAGKDKSYTGDIVFSQGYSVGMLEQEPELDPTKTVREIVEEGVAEVVALLKEFDEINEAFGDPDADFDKLLERQGTVQEKLDHHNAWELDTRLERAMDALRCPPSDQNVANLSGGEKRRVALCRLLLQEPDVLLLDEPTNHLDAESVLWLEEHLRQYKGTVIAVTHDRYFLDNVAGWILELDRGEGIPWKGNYSSWLEQKQNRLAKEEKTESRRQKTLQRELEWVRMSPKARQAKSKARLEAYDKLMSEENRQKEDKLELFIPAGPRLGNKVIEVQGVTKAYGDKLLFDNLTFSLPPAGIVGIVGPNGAGKSTLFKLITGQVQPDAGTFEVGETVQMAYVDQEHNQLAADKSVFELVSGGTEMTMLGGRQVNARAYVSKFNFNGADQEKKIGLLSGGERNRVHLAMMLKEGANLLLLDEPTNDLDVNTLRALEEALENFGGCAVVISHDRWFLDRIATHILAFEGDSQVYWFEGNFSDYEENRKKRLGNDATPKRIRYKKLGD